ncbi:hypothetical protein KSS87_005937 [Heliosperma pusillum]|nr:hypothetical protein KSS87_011781 [Heliosperma pusillum]KAH9613366.1 hypothetical protein KSS87_005937 [Heliosperma pusillum]
MPRVCYSSLYVLRPLSRNDIKLKAMTSTMPKGKGDINKTVTGDDGLRTTPVRSMSVLRWYWWWWCGCPDIGVEGDS